MVRSGHLEAGRITLIDADIDLSAPGGARHAASRAAGPLAAGPRLLSRWRGGRIDIEGGTYAAGARRGAPPCASSAGTPTCADTVRDWSAEARC